MDLKLQKLREQANAASTVYQKTRLDYAYIELVLHLFSFQMHILFGLIN